MRWVKPPRIPHIRKPRFQQGWYISMPSPAWVLATFKKIKGLNKNVGILMEKHVMWEVYKSMKRRVPRDTGKLKDAIKYVTPSKGKSIGYNRSPYKYDASLFKAIHIDMIAYQQGVRTGAPPRTTIQSAWYQEKGYTPTRIPSRWTDIDSRYFNENKGAKMTPRKHHPFIMPAIFAIWGNNKCLRKVLDMAFAKSRKEFNKKTSQEKNKFWTPKQRKEDEYEEQEHENPYNAELGSV
jgi:hypothetical protein